MSTRDPGFCLRQVRHHLRRPDRAADARHHKPGAAGDLRDRPDQCQPQPDHQPDSPPFDNPELRRAMALSLDRKAFIDIITEGKGNIGGAMLPPPEGVWGMPAEMLHDLARLRPRCEEEPRGSPRRSCRSSAMGRTSGSRSRCRRATSRRIRDPAVILTRPAEGDLYRCRARTDRDDPLVSQSQPQGLHGRAQRDRQRHRRSRPEILRELRVRRGAQLHQILQPRARQAGRPAIDRGRPGEAQAAGVGDRAQAGRGRGAADHLLRRAAATAGSPTSRA